MNDGGDVSRPSDHDLDLYMVDTCSFTALRRTYPREVPPFEPVWRTVEILAERKRLFSIDLVLEELNAMDDEVSQWANAHGDLFLPLVRRFRSARGLSSPAISRSSITRRRNPPPTRF